MTYTAHRDSASLLWALLLCAGFAGAAHAQVQRCTDAKGHTTYTDGPCLQGQRGKEVVPALTAEERALEHLRYEQAMERRREEQLINAQRNAARQAEQDAEAARRPPAPVVVHVPTPAAPPAEVIYPPAYYPPHPPHAKPPPPRPQPGPGSAGTANTQCNAFRCYDVPAPAPGRMLNRP